MPSKH
jgi:IS30 family transposase